MKFKINLFSLWLILLGLFVCIIILIGGYTRISDSGLSITEWQPISGILFPTNEHQWLIEFSKYKLIDEFKLIIENGEHSAALYFNLGNSYYKINDLANSIYYYEKALKLMPNDSDVLNNLSYSQNMLIDKVEKLPINQVSEFFNLISNIFLSLIHI